MSNYFTRQANNNPNAKRAMGAGQAGNKIYTSKMEVGSSFTGSFLDVQEGKFGPVYKFMLHTDKGDEEVVVYPSGNLKFLADDFAKGKKDLMKAYVITRTPDIQVKTFTVSQFKVEAVNEMQAAQATAPQVSNVTGAATTQTPAASNSPTASIQEKLAAIRAKKTPNA